MDLGKRSNYSIGLRIKTICPVEELQNMSSQIFQAMVGSKPPLHAEGLELING